LPCETLDLPGLHHFSIMTELENPEAALTRALRRRLGLA